MVSIAELLPLLDGWDYLTDSIPNIVLNAGQRKPIGPTVDWGWVRGVLVVTNSPYLEVSTNVWEKPIIFTPYSLFVFGLLVENRSSPYVLVYDPANSLYVMGYTPYPHQEFKTGFIIDIRAANQNPFGTPITTQTTIHYLSYNMVVVKDRKKFFNSYKLLNAGETITKSEEEFIKSTEKR